MNTPAHAVINLLILGKKEKPQYNLPIIFGGILPDLPMVIFYLYEKFWRGIPERIIWSESYYNDSWQNIFDIFNSLPLIILGVLLAYYYGINWLTALFASMAFHSFEDLPLHNDDAHRHFFPLSDWRFNSPVSYWDPHHYGNIIAPLEGIVVVIVCFILWKKHTSRTSRVLLSLVISTYILYFGYAFFVWG